MNTFTDITTFKTTPTSIIDGQIWAKNEVKLHVDNVLALDKKSSDIQMNKQKDLAVVQATKNAFDLEMRHASHIVAKGTVYGIPSSWNLEITHNSLLGVNKSCLNTNGTINYQSVIKRIREVVHSVDAKEQRLNMYFDTVYSQGFYDNMTSLLFLILAKLELFDIVAKMNTHDHETTLTLVQVHRLMAAVEEDRPKLLARMLETQDDGYGMSLTDVSTWLVVDRIKGWYDQLPQEVTQSDETIRANNTEAFQFKYTIKVWHMYTYNDGHSSSGNAFGKHFGFIKGRFAVPTHLFHTAPEVNVTLIAVNQIYPDTDIAIRALADYKGALNLSGFTTREVAILTTLLQGNTRSTPFLVDQDIDFRLGRASIRAFNAPVIQNGRGEYTKRELQSMFGKLVRNHRVYEEAKQASILLRYWVAQPATETVESHWWTHIKRSLRLPKLGLSRASLPELVQGEGICISDDAQDLANTLTGPGQSSIFLSLFMNTCWYWGEFLSIYNSINTEDLMRKMRFTIHTGLDETYRADALVSAITGKRILRCAFHDCYTYINEGLDSQYSTRVRFGQLNIPHLQDYGYQIIDDQIMFQKLVAPSCVALILGLNGTLLEGTPYGSSFSMNNAVQIVEYGIRREGLNYMDLWAYGVLARWNGHDLYYKHPLTDGRHKIYAANDVSVAVPPVPPSGLRRAESYKLDGLVNRNISWGSPLTRLLDTGAVFSWERINLFLLDRPEWRSPKAPYSEEQPKLHKEFRIDTNMVENYLGAVMTRYDAAMSDFQVVQIRPGVAMPGDAKILDLLPQEVEPDPPEPPQLEPDAGQND